MACEGSERCCQRTKVAIIAGVAIIVGFVVYAAYRNKKVKNPSASDKRMPSAGSFSSRYGFSGGTAPAFFANISTVRFGFT
ncbi:unnamed protein product [Heligmosomoides polygyrus]|uniref:CX domain-containing protein n=1 Tax=Heligmosomoides polygyrus TaxID=6339 RepID=A0A3P7Y6S7_HELPZ|nr:unnamed protein product [Heligmosomoides polygyrus]